MHRELQRTGVRPPEHQRTRRIRLPRAPSRAQQHVARDHLSPMCGFTIARTTDAAASAAAQAGLVQAQLTAISVQPTQFSRGCDSTLSVGLSSPICSDPSQVRAPTLPAAPPRLPLLPPCPLGGRGLSGRCVTPQAAAASYKLIIQGASSGGGDVALTSAPVSSCSRESLTTWQPLSS